MQSQGFASNNENNHVVFVVFYDFLLSLSEETEWVWRVMHTSATSADSVTSITVPLYQISLYFFPRTLLPTLISLQNKQMEKKFILIMFYITDLKKD